MLLFKSIILFILLIVFFSLIDIFIDKIQNGKIKKVIGIIFKILFFASIWGVFYYLGIIPLPTNQVEVDSNIAIVIKVIVTFIAIAGLVLSHKYYNKHNKNIES
jgi:hypothetical protein